MDSIDKSFTDNIIGGLNFYLKKSIMPFIFFLQCTICPAQEKATDGAAVDYINVYQQYLSGLKNTRCSMYPSCSNYAKMVFRDNSFHIAMVLTADRLIRCSHDLDIYQTTYAYGFPAAVDYPNSRIIPDGILPNLKSQPIFVSNSFDTDSTSQSLKYIVFLINQQNYQGALNEIDKTLFDGDHNSFSNIYAYKLKCYEGLDRYKDGIMAFEQLFPYSAKNQYLTLFNVAHLYDLVNNEDSALKYYKEAAALYSSNKEYAHPFSEIGKICAEQRRYDDARSAFREKYIIDNNYDAYQSSLNIIQDLESLKRKRKSVAMALSIIPGGGYIYTGQPKNALTSLIINSVLGYASYTSFKNKNYGLGIIMSALTLSFYTGNIFGAGNSANLRNNSNERKTLVKLRAINPFIN